MGSGFDVTFQTGQGDEVAWFRTCINLTQHGGVIASPAGLIYQLNKEQKQLNLVSSFPPGNPEFDYNQLEETRQRHVEVCKQLGYAVLDKRSKEPSSG